MEFVPIFARTMFFRCHGFFNMHTPNTEPDACRVMYFYYMCNNSTLVVFSSSNTQEEQTNQSTHIQNGKRSLL